MKSWKTLAGAILVIICAGCGTAILPGDRMPEPGSRQWIITVDNQSGQAARLFVAEDAGPMGDLLGRAEPSTVPPKTTHDVIFVVPPGDGWAIFVNPRPDRGALILSRDVPPNVSGKLPVTIHIGPDGEPGVVVPADVGPGWFGT